MMREVMSTYGVNTVTSNNVLEIFRTLGDEAAKYIFTNYKSKNNLLLTPVL